MTEYIKKSIAIAIVSDSADMYPFEKNEAIRRIEDSTPAEVAPVVHGRWEYDENATDWGIGGYICSECKTKNNNLPCNRVKSVRMFSGAKFCPTCGAKMDLEDCP